MTTEERVDFEIIMLFVILTGRWPNETDIDQLKELWEGVESI